jgi:threonine dehydrogenase-like Zn-dependent dehydrogenase
VIVCEVDKGRMEIARKMGAHIVIDSSKEDPAARIKELTENRGADVVFLYRGYPEVAAQSVAMAGKLGRVVFYSSFHPDKPIEINPNRVHSAETVITGSVNPTPAISWPLRGSSPSRLWILPFSSPSGSPRESRRGVREGDRSVDLSCCGTMRLTEVV